MDQWRWAQKLGNSAGQVSFWFSGVAGSVIGLAVVLGDQGSGVFLVKTRLWRELMRIEELLSNLIQNAKRLPTPLRFFKVVF